MPCIFLSLNHISLDHGWQIVARQLVNRGDNDDHGIIEAAEDRSAMMENCGDHDGAGGEAAKMIVVRRLVEAAKDGRVVAQWG